MKSYFKQKYLFVIIPIIILMLLAAGGILLADDNTINLEIEIKEDENTAELTWSVKDKDTNLDSYTYTVERSVNDSKTYTEISSLPKDTIHVLNVYPTGTYNESTTEKASFLLKNWMESPNVNSENGYGKGLIEVTPVSINEFNNSPEKYLSGNAGSETSYKYDVIFFGSWDSYGGNSTDLKGNLCNIDGTDEEQNTVASTSEKGSKKYENKTSKDGAVKSVEDFIKTGGSVIFGHDTIGLHEGQKHPNFAYLGEKYVGITTDTTYTQHPCDQVYICRTGVFTSYPWDITDDLKDFSGKQCIQIPKSHCLGQHASGDIWLKFNTSDYGTDDMNFYLTTYRNNSSDNGTKNGMCAMIQTGHSSGTADPSEEKIIANLIFYLSTIDKINGHLTDGDFRDINAPTVTVSESDITTNRNKATVKITGKDEGTTYHYYVIGVSNADSTKKVESSKKEATRKATGIVKYEYIVDGNNETNLDNESSNKKTVTTDAKNELTTSIECTVGDTPKTYLHIRAIDGAGNKGETQHVLIYTNNAPKITLKQSPMEWTNSDVTIVAEGTDKEGKVEKVSVNGENISTSKAGAYDENTKKYEQEFKATKNGTYTFTGTDNGSVTGNASIEITNIDKTDPEGTIKEEKENDRKVTITATDNESGIARVILTNGENEEKVIYINEEAIEKNASGTKTSGEKTKEVTYTFEESDEYNKVIIEDIAGNKKEIELGIDSEGLEIKYVDSNHPEAGVLKTTTEQTGKVGESYTAEAEEIEGYKLVGIKVNGEEVVGTETKIEGVYTVGKQTIEYEYKKESKVIVKHKDANTGEEIAEETEESYLEGDTYKVSAKDIKNYIVDKDKENEGTMGREDKVVEFKYRKITEGLVVKYVDEITGNVLGEKIYEGGEGEKIKTEAIEIEGYKLTKSPKVTEIGLTVEGQEVKYYYKKIIKIEIVGKDEKTGEELYRIEKEGLEGEGYKTEARDVNRYKVDKEKMPKNARGTYQKAKEEVVYLYNKVSGGIKVEHIDIDTNKIIKEERYDGIIGEKYTTEERKLKNYNYVKTEGKTKGEMTEEEIVIKYYYKNYKKELDETPKTGSANVALITTVVSAISLAGIVTVKRYTK